MEVHAGPPTGDEASEPSWDDLIGGHWYHPGEPKLDRKELKPQDATLLDQHSWSVADGSRVYSLKYLEKGNHFAAWRVSKNIVLKLDYWSKIDPKEFDAVNNMKGC